MAAGGFDFFLGKSGLLRREHRLRIAKLHNNVEGVAEPERCSRLTSGATAARRGDDVPDRIRRPPRALHFWPGEAAAQLVSCPPLVITAEPVRRIRRRVPERRRPLRTDDPAIRSRRRAAVEVF